MLTTHDLGDVENLCERLVIIDQGKLIYDGPRQAVTDTFARDRTIHFQIRQPLPSLEDLVDSLSGANLEQTGELEFAVRFNRFVVSAGEVASHVMRHADVVDFRIDEPKIEDVIKRVYNRELDLAMAATSRG